MGTDKKTSTGEARGTPAQPQSDSRPPAARREQDTPAPTKPSSSAEVAEFVRRVKTLAPQTSVGSGRLIFAMDATMSRQPTWDLALALQADMFQSVKEVGGLDVQLVYFRGAGECRASKWVGDPDALARLMTTVECHGGYTQIRKVLLHARREAEKKRVNALVYVGDCMEEDADDLCGRAGELALHGVPVFMFQEGHDARAERTFRQIARLTKGAWCRFDAGSADQLRELLSAVAVYAAGGRQALERLVDKRGARLLLAEMKHK
ncbi:MAG TPA: VWA domain-containing protein [Hyphomicrobiaceae bacterium]|nr:VWA domain-containing protein [Hyphomicrobiaceae bacterium]